MRSWRSFFSATRVSAFGHGPSSEMAEQRKWLKDREHSCRVPDRQAWASPAKCLTSYYNHRNHELAVASLFTEPPLALETLHKLDPEAASLYEVIALYADGPAEWTWDKSPQRPRMLQLLQPYFERFQTDKDMVFGREILADAGIKTPADMLKSELNFIEFLQIASAYLQSDPIPRPLPCAAIVRKPELLGASDAVFGSTLDNFIFYPDCAVTLPPLPALDRLVAEINQGWPECDGTIRFSAYRMYDSAQNQARVAQLGDIRRLARSPEARRGVRMPRLRGVSSARIAAAFAELANYYQTYQKAPAGDARVFARFKVHDILASGHNCGGFSDG
jgi:hypothetical protein